MRAARIAVVAVAVGLALWSSTPRSHAQATDPLVGTWTLDVSKSKYSPGPAPKSATLTISESADGVKVVFNPVLSDGRAIHQEYTAKVDGKDYPVSGSPTVDAVSLMRKDNTRTLVEKKGGKIVTTHEGVLSADGKTFTVQSKGTDPKGQPVNNSVVYVKKM